MKQSRHFIRACLGLLLVSLLANPVFARQESPGEFIRVIIDFKVKEGHGIKFEKSLKEWKECYLSHGGQTAWNTFRRMDGEGESYVLTYVKPNWAAFDMKDGPAGSCHNLAELMLSPHIEVSSSFYTKFMPDISIATPPETVAVVLVTFFKVKMGGYASFMDNIKTMSEHINTVEGNKRGYWYRYMGGGENAPDFFVSTALGDFASLDERKGVWESLENGLGKEKKDELYEMFFQPVKHIYSHMYRLVPELSHETEE